MNRTPAANRSESARARRVRPDDGASIAAAMIAAAANQPVERSAFEADSASDWTSLAERGAGSRSFAVFLLENEGQAEPVGVLWAFVSEGRPGEADLTWWWVADAIDRKLGLSVLTKEARRWISDAGGQRIRTAVDTTDEAETWRAVGFTEVGLAADQRRTVFERFV